jgi:hypothetical protein
MEIITINIDPVKNRGPAELAPNACLQNIGLD